MPTAVAETTPSPEELLEAVARLGPAELDVFTSRVLALRAGRAVYGAVGPEEAELIRRINEGVPEDVQQRFNLLTQRRRAETLTESEHAELLTLVRQIEQIDAVRLERLAALARLRGVTLRTVIDQLGLQQQPHD